MCLKLVLIFNIFPYLSSKLKGQCKILPLKNYVNRLIGLMCNKNSLHQFTDFVCLRLACGLSVVTVGFLFLLDSHCIFFLFDLFVIDMFQVCLTLCSFRKIIISLPSTWVGEVWGGGGWGLKPKSFEKYVTKLDFPAG